MPIIEKREFRSRQCKDKSVKKEDETESEDPIMQIELPQKRELAAKSDINPAPQKLQKLTKRQNQLVKNKAPS